MTRVTRCRSRALWTSLACLALAVAAPPVAARPTDPADIRVMLTPIVSGLDRPTSVTNAGDGTGRLFITEQAGRIRLFSPRRGLRDVPYLDLTDRVLSTHNEQGLLSLAFAPDFPADGRLFLQYTRQADGAVVISEFQADRDAADLASERVILAVEKELPTHNGGMLAFDRAGRLLVSLGDGGYADPPLRTSQDPRSLLGKLIRLEVDPPIAYRSDPDGEGAWPEVLAMGLRNPWRFSLDPDRDVLYIGDVGQWSWEEVDVLRLDSGSVVNFGWSDLEGPVCAAFVRCDPAQHEAPALAYAHDPNASLIGGYAYRGSREPLLVGRYLFADLSYAQLMVAPVDDLLAGAAVPEVVARQTWVRSFGEDEGGELYVLTADQLLEVRAEPAPAGRPPASRPQGPTSRSLDLDISGLVVRTLDEAPPSIPLVVVSEHDAALTWRSADCVVVAPTDIDPYLTFDVPADGGLTVIPEVAGTVEVFLPADGVPATSQRLRITATQGQILHLSLPGRPSEERTAIRVDVPLEGETTVCGASADLDP